LVLCEGDDTPSSASPQTTTVASAPSETPVPGPTTPEPAAAPTLTVAEQGAQDRAEQTKIARAQVKAKVEAKKKAEQRAEQKAKKRAEQEEKEKKAAAKAEAAAKREAAQNPVEAKLTFAKCPAMNPDVPHGVGQRGAKGQASCSRVTSSKVSDHIYARTRDAIATATASPARSTRKDTGTAKDVSEELGLSQMTSVKDPTTASAALSP
jgi:membrane protein involved in colicin uptake